MSQYSTEFENVVLHELSRAWFINVHNFEWDNVGVFPPNFRITNAQVSHWGQWDPNTREMHFSRHLITNRPWSEVLEVLKHEMAHQYVSEVLHIVNEDPHGPAFQQVCKQYLIDAAPRGLPGANKVDAPNHIVEKIRHLLKLAENSGATSAESQAAAEAAHNMMLKHNITLQEKNDQRHYTVRYLGKITGRIQGWMSVLANMLSKFYFVEIIWVSAYDPRAKKRGYELEVSGTIDNVEVAEYVFDFVSRAALEAWNKKVKSPEYKDQVKRHLEIHYYQKERSYTMTARYNFLLGFVRGFKSQLEQAEVKEQEAGLVLVKDPGLEDFYRQRHPKIRHLTKSSGRYNSTMSNQGFAEGSSLRMPPAAKSNKQYIPLLGE